MAASTYTGADSFSASLQSQIDALKSGSRSFIADGNYITVEELKTSYPPSATYANMSANISNLFHGGDPTKGIQEQVNCRLDLTNNVYRWVPRRSDFNMKIASPGGVLNLVALVTPPTLVLSGTLTSNQTISPLSNDAFVGEKRRIIQNSTLGLFTTTVTGLIGSNLTLLANAMKDIEFGPTGWFASS